jgi:hypothetical protein
LQALPAVSPESLLVEAIDPLKALPKAVHFNFVATTATAPDRIVKA